MAIEWDKNTRLLLHGDSFEDSSYYSVPITNNGVQVLTAQSKFGEKSLYFNGNAKLFFPQKTIRFGSDDFTIDWWEYADDSGAKSRFCSAYTGQNAGGLLLGYNSTLVYCGATAYDWSLISGAVMFNVEPRAWVHWAVVRVANTLTTYRNGKRFAQTPINGSIAYDTAYDMVLGDYRSGDPNPFKGYIDEFRISDVARWIEDFEPPIAPYEPYQNILKIPSITGAQITPQTVYTGSKITISVEITEKTIILYPEERYAGEIYAGEV